MSLRNRQTSLRLATLVACAQLLSGCFLTDVLPTTEKPKHTGGGGPGETPPAQPTEAAPSRLPPAKIARRLALDFGLTLPSAADVALLVEAEKLTKPPQPATDPATGTATEVPPAAPAPAPATPNVPKDPEALDKAITQLVDAYLSGAPAARALASLHPRMWHLGADDLPDLDGYVAAGDTALGGALTTATRAAIVEEPSLLVRHTLTERQPFSTVFTAPYTIASDAMLTFWGLGSDGSPWAGEPYQFATYPDARPAAGILATNGLLAAFSGRDETHPRHRTARLLAELACLPLENAAAHKFYDLTAEELASDLTTLGATRKVCAGCHAQFEGAAPGLAGLGVGSDLAGWKDYDAPASDAGFYAGHAYTGLAALGADFGADPRTHRCEVKKLASALFQRRLGGGDQKTLALALDRFYAGDQALAEATRELVRASTYLIDVTGPTLKGDALYFSSGVRVLRGAQWRAIVERLAPGATVEYPAALDPGEDELLTSDDAVPSGSYWHAADVVARQAAAAIVAAELADGTPAVTRKLLKDLPDGSGFGATPLVVYAQIKAVWKALTTEDLGDGAATFLAFQTLWAEAKPEASADEFRRAWRTLLVAMMTHPQFLTY